MMYLTVNEEYFQQDGKNHRIMGRYTTHPTATRNSDQSFLFIVAHGFLEVAKGCGKVITKLIKKFGPPIATPKES